MFQECVAKFFTSVQYTGPVTHSTNFQLNADAKRLMSVFEKV